MVYPAARRGYIQSSSYLQKMTVATLKMLWHKTLLRIRSLAVVKMGLTHQLRPRAKRDGCEPATGIARPPRDQDLDRRPCGQSAGRNHSVGAGVGVGYLRPTGRLPRMSFRARSRVSAGVCR